MSKTLKTKVISYLRTSSATNTGSEKDSEARQRQAIAQYASTNGFEIVDSFYDAAVSGTDALETRPGFAALLDRIEANGVRTVLLEDSSRLARDLLTQELGLAKLQALGVAVLTSGGEDLTQTVDPIKVAMRQIVGAFSQLEKARLVAKLKHARDAKRALTGRCEGRKPICQREPMACARANAIANEKLFRPSLRKIANQLYNEGFKSVTRKPYSAEVIKTMIA